MGCESVLTRSAVPSRQISSRLEGKWADQVFSAHSWRRPCSGVALTSHACWGDVDLQGARPLLHPRTAARRLPLQQPVGGVAPAGLPAGAQHPAAGLRVRSIRGADLRARSITGAELRRMTLEHGSRASSNAPCSKTPLQFKTVQPGKL